MEQLFPVGISFCFYTACCSVLHTLVTPPKNISYKDQKDYLGQHVSFVHSLIACVMAVCFYYIDGGVQYSKTTEYRHIVLLGHSLGYFIYDTIYAEVFRVHDLAMRFHHVCILGGGFIMQFSSNGPLGPVCTIITELSNPCMQLRFILRALNKEKTRMFSVFELIFAVIFIVNR